MTHGDQVSEDGGGLTVLFEHSLHLWETQRTVLEKEKPHIVHAHKRSRRVTPEGGKGKASSEEACAYWACRQEK